MLVTLYVPFYTSLTHYLTKWLIYPITIIVSLPYIQSEFVSIYFPRYKVTTRMCNAWRTVVVHGFIIYLFLINLFFILLSFPCLRKCCANIWLRYVSQWFSGCWYRPLSARNAGPGQIKTANASIYRKSGRVCCSDTLCRAREHTAFVRVLSLSPSLSCLWCRTQREKRERENNYITKRKTCCIPTATSKKNHIAHLRQIFLSISLRGCHWGWHLPTIISVSSLSWFFVIVCYVCMTLLLDWFQNRNLSAIIEMLSS